MKNKIINYIKKNYKLIIYISFLIILNCLFLKQLDVKISINHNKSIFKIMIVIVFLIEVLLLFLYKKFKKLEDHKIFLIFYLIFGIVYMVLIPLGKVPDECNHFLRAYEISNGHLISDKKSEEIVGESYSESIKQFFVEEGNYSQKISDFKSNSKENKQYSYANTSLYSFICYIPQTIGIIIGKLLNLPLSIIAYLGRLTNFIIYTIIAYFSLKKIPILKKVCMLILFLPICLQESISLSPDALTNAISFAFVSFILYSIYNKDKIFSKKDYIFMTLMAIIISLCKIVYVPLCLLLFLLPKSKFKDGKKIKNLLIVILIAGMLNLMWLKISTNFLIEFNEGVNSSEQIMYILTNPFKYILVMFNTFEYSFINLAYESLGHKMEYHNILLSRVYLLIYFVIIVSTVIKENTANKNINNIVRIIFGMVFLICTLLIFTSLYVQWTPLKAQGIIGIQGRYFCPLLLILAIALKNNNIKFKHKNKNFDYVYVSLIFLNIYSLFTIFMNHIF